MACQRRTVYETLLGGGEVFRIEERENMRTMFGRVACSKMGEASWRTDSVEVKVSLSVFRPAVAYARSAYCAHTIGASRRHAVLGVRAADLLSRGGGKVDDTPRD